MSIQDAPGTSINLRVQNLLTPPQVAQILGVSTKTLSVWRCTGRYDLPFVKSGRLVRYRSEDIQGFIDRRLVGFRKDSK